MRLSSARGDSGMGWKRVFEATLQGCLQNSSNKLAFTLFFAEAQLLLQKVNYLRKDLFLVPHLATVISTL